MSAVAVVHGALLQAPGLLAGAAEPSPSPSVLEIPAEDQTSPGFLGFIVTFGVAVVVILLAFSLVRHLRVADHNARRLEAEQDGADVAAAGAAADGVAASTGRPGPAGPSAAAAHPARTGDPAAALAAAEAGAPASEEPGVLDPDDDGELPSDPPDAEHDSAPAPGPVAGPSTDPAPGGDR